MYASNVLILEFGVIILASNVLSKIDVAVDKNNKINNDDGNELLDHSMVTSSNKFPYVAAILKQSTYISSGALVHDSWVLTGGDALFLVRESARELRVRLGSINCRKGGVLMPIKLFEIHPYFNDTKPEYDIALIKLPKPVKFTPNLYPIKMQKKLREVVTTHFLVTSWPILTKKTSSEEVQILKSMETIKRRRIMTVSHLHPTLPELCEEVMEMLEIENKKSLMCLDQTVKTNPCLRDVGAPVVLNGILWGIISSYRPEDCDVDPVPRPSFVTLVAAPGINTWIHSVVKGHSWNNNKFRVVVENKTEVIKDSECDSNSTDTTLIFTKKYNETIPMKLPNRQS